MAVTYLHLDVQNAVLSLLRYVLHSLHTGAIEIAAELCMLDEAVLIYQLLEVLYCHEVVVLAIFLTVSWLPGGMRHREPESARICGKEALEQCRLPRAGRARDDDGTTMFRPYRGELGL